MENLKRLLNRIAREQHFTTAQNQLAKASYDCGLMNDVLNDLVASGIPGYETRRLTAFREIGLRIKRIKIHIEDICDSDYFIVDGLMELVEAILVLIEESICILNWLGGIQGVVLRASLGTLGAIITYLKTLANNPLLFHDAKDLWCRSMQRIIFALDGLDILEELGIDEGPTLQVQSTPITCPTRIPVTVDIEWWESFLIWALDGVDPADMEAAGNAATCVGVLTGVLAASGPIFVCTTGVKGLSAATAALAVFVGVDRASAIENQLVMCTPDDNDICCAGGQVHEGWTFEECLEIGGAWGDPEHTECVPFSHE